MNDAKCEHSEGGGWIDTENGSELRCLLCGAVLAKGWSDESGS